MDLATVIGFILAALVLAGAVLLGDVPIGLLLNPEALLVVFGGTITATMISFSARTLWGAFDAMCACFRKEDWDLNTTVDEMTAVAGFVRKEGILALQPLLDDLEQPFLRQGLQMLIDNAPEHLVRERLATEIEVSYRESMDFARVFEAAGGYAPTMGIIGALIGLIHVVSGFKNPEMLGKGVAGAFSATLFGVAISNLFLLPIAGKLRQRARDEWFRKTLMMQGIASISANEHPIVLEEKLQGFLNGISANGDTGIAQGRNAMKNLSSRQAMEIRRDLQGIRPHGEDLMENSLDSLFGKNTVTPGGSVHPADPVLVGAAPDDDAWIL